MNKPCPNFNAVARLKRASDGRWLMTRLRCKSWQCDVCADKNRAMWNRHLQRQCSKIGGIWWFGTLTAPAWARTAEASLNALRLNFDRFWKRLRRVFKHVEYARVYEVHQNGAYHIHVVVQGLAARLRLKTARSGIKSYKPAASDDRAMSCALQTWWKKTSSKCKMGYIGEIKPIPAREAVRYICKYMTKAAQAFDCPHLRRIQTSRGIGSPNVCSNEVWLTSGHLWGGDIGYSSFIDLNSKTLITSDYWRDEVVYPPEI